MRETFRGLELDRFQREAMDGIARDENVIVAAPTGAGKTLIAHYAIERALAEGKRAVYTAPIKALSNQKYRDLSEAYPGKVGISTGDVSIDAGAPVVVMTTEIFRNSIFDAPERTAEVGWVIFDEVHYLDDPERGTVWEESLIFAPPGVRILALSATVSNLREFAAWIGEVRDHPVRVVLEQTRPVPLEVFVASTEGKIRPLERIDQLRLSERGMRSRFRRRAKDLRGYYEQSQLDLVHEIAQREQLPLLFFLFSRAACERLATAVAGRQDLQPSPAAGKAAREELDRLAAAFSLDLSDPDLKTLVTLVERGVAYHHAGVMPVLKEVVERLFGAGHIKLLCATETFALGVNMPARSVAFEGVMRWNGKARVPLMTRQYQQMAGRAGRRGIDERGSVYLTWDPFRDEARAVTGIVLGKVEPVRSQFDLSYGTLLNLYRRLGDELYAACEKSFANYRPPSRGGAVRRRASRDPEREQSSVYEQAVAHGEQREKRDRRGPQRGKSRRGRREREEARSEGQPGRGGRRAKGRYEGVVEQVRLKVGILHELGYIDRRGEITRQGRFAMQVFGHELELSEILFAGGLEGLSPEQIAVVAAAIVFESRPSNYYAGPDPRRVVGKQNFRLAEEAIHRLTKLEDQRGIKQASKPLDWSLTGATWAWAQGAEFAELRELSDGSDGDVVRALRQTIQLLRLAVDPLRNLGEEGLANKFRQAHRLLKRDLVDAEWQLRRAAELERAGLTESDLAGDDAALEEDAAGEGDVNPREEVEGRAEPDDEDEAPRAARRARRRPGALEQSEDMLGVLPDSPRGLAPPAPAAPEPEPEEEDPFTAGLL